MPVLETTTMLSLLTELAKGSPFSEFLSEGPGLGLTYEAAHTLATQLLPTRLSQVYPDLGREYHVRVAIISANNSLFPLVLWALWNLGAVAVLLPASADPSMWGSMAAVARVDLFLVAKDIRPRLNDALVNTAGGHRPMVELESLIPSEFLEPRGTGQATSLPFALIPACSRWANSSHRRVVNQVDHTVISPDTPIVTLFTSSAVDITTLKCVTYTHSILVASARRTIKGLGGDTYRSIPKRHLGWLPLSHCFELTVSLCGIVFMTGGTYVVHDSRISSPALSGSTSLSDAILESLIYHQPIQSLCTVPAILEKLPEVSPSKYLKVLKALDNICVGGAPSSTALYHWALRENIAFFDFLGATEVAGGVCIGEIQSTPARGLEVLDGLMGVLEKKNSSDPFGELIVVGKDIPMRYDNLESPAYALTQNGETIYRTGDIYGQHLGFLSRSIKVGDELPPYDPCAAALAGLHYIGRLDDILILNSGIKIDALGIERALDACPEIRRSAVVLNAEGDAIVALIEGEAGSPLSHQKIVDAVLRSNSRLSFERRIRVENICIVSALPVTTKSTLHRKKLKKIIRDAGGSWPQGPEPGPYGQSRKATSFKTYPDVHETFLHSKETEKIHEQLKILIAQVLSVPTSEVSDPLLYFSKLGMTSLSYVRLSSAIQNKFSVNLKTSQLYGFSSIVELCRWITQGQDERPLPTNQVTASTAPSLSENLAITGASCRFPGGINNLSSFWDALVAPTVFFDRLARTPPPSRWNNISDLDLPRIGWIEGLEHDDINSFSSFFELPPSDVKSMTPNARLALKLAYNAIEDAGIAPKSLDGKAWGVFSSVSDSGWREKRLEEVGLQEYGKALGGVADDAVGARLSYFLNLTGPAIEVKTACSSSAVAVHQACAAIRNGDCEAAIVVSATTHFFPAGSIFRKSAGIVSSHGRCATFSQDADGFLPSEGAAAIVIQKASNARADLYAYIRGSSVTQDGRSQGFAAPNPVAQTRLLHMAFRHANVVPDDIAYIETHGTGTFLGDAVEIEALNQAFGTKRTHPLIIGAVKAVIGHTEECAGLAGIIKCLLCFYHNAIPPQTGISTVSTELDLFASKLVIPRRITAFVDSKQPRLVGVSSFGLSGTLAHIILQKEIQTPFARSRPPFIPSVFVISAQSPADLAASISSWLEYMESSLFQDSHLEDICFTSQVARDKFRYRYAWPVLDHKTLCSHLRRASESSPPSCTLKRPAISFWFGAPRSCLPCLLVIDHPTYLSTMVECADAMGGVLPTTLTYYARQLALAKTLASLGCNITSVGGEGPGEFVAAAFSGVLDITGLFRLLSAMEPLRGQEAVAFEAPLDVIMERLLDFNPQDLRVRAQHREDQTTLIGIPEAMCKFCKTNADIRRLSTHEALSLRLPHTIPISTFTGNCRIVSPCTGGILCEELTLNPNYWLGTLDREFDARSAWAKLDELSDFMLILGDPELAPHDTISSYHDKSDCKGIGEVSPNNLLACLFEAGCDIAWETLNHECSVVRLPGYEWAKNTKKIC